MAIKALSKGINVLIEKPCSVSLDEVDALRKAQANSGKQLAVCFQNRYNPCVQQAKKIILSGEMGKVKAARAFVTWFRDKAYYSDDWHGTLDKECGGVLINQSIHTMDLLQYLSGRCEKVTAHVSNDSLKGIIEVEDTASVLLELDGGVNAVFYATLAYAENSPVFIDISLENGKLRIEGEKLFVTDANGCISEATTKADTVYHGQHYWGSGHSSLINDYYYCLKSGKKFEIDAFEGGKAAKIVAAAYESSKKCETVQVERS
jgi:predicted dehydrogenase